MTLNLFCPNLGVTHAGHSTLTLLVHLEEQVGFRMSYIMVNLLLMKMFDLGPKIKFKSNCVFLRILY